MHVDPQVPSVRITTFSGANAAGGGFARLPVPVKLLRVFLSSVSLAQFLAFDRFTSKVTYKSELVLFSGVDWYAVKESPINGTAEVIWDPLV